MTSEDEEIARKVAEHGWHAIAVDDVFSLFVYTCGLLTSFNHPELIVFGLGRREGYSLLALMVEDVRNGRPFAQRRKYDGILQNQPILIGCVHPTQHEF